MPKPSHRGDVLIKEQRSGRNSGFSPCNFHGTNWTMCTEANFPKSELRMLGVREQDVPSHEKSLTPSLGSGKNSMFS